MDQALKEKLPQLSLSNLHQLDQGKLSRQWNRLMGRIIENISDFPIRDGKPETREISIRILMCPQVKNRKQALETSYGVTEVDVPEICGMTVKAIIKDKLPIFESGNVECLVDVRNGRISDLRFNPNNSQNPSQLELFSDVDDLGGDDDDEGDD